ncbi:MAG: hypothetical protein ACPGWR_02675 [Ardenticatenaceae bacterium]
MGRYWLPKAPASPVHEIPKSLYPPASPVHEIPKSLYPPASPVSPVPPNQRQTNEM